MPRPPVMFVKSPSQWRVLLSPVRSEIVQGLRCLGPCSVAELAAALDRPADTLYRHIEQLQAAGFVAQTGQRKRGRHTEQLIDSTADDFAIDFAEASERAAATALMDTSKSFLRSTARGLRDSLAAQQIQLHPDDERNLVLNYEVTWLTPQEFQQYRRLILRLKQLMDRGRTRRQGRLYVTLNVALPIARRRRRSAVAPDLADTSTPSPDSPPAATRRTKKARPKSRSGPID